MKNGEMFTTNQLKCAQHFGSDFSVHGEQPYDSNCSFHFEEIGKHIDLSQLSAAGVRFKSDNSIDPYSNDRDQIHTIHRALKL